MAITQTLWPINTSVSEPELPSMQPVSLSGYQTSHALPRNPHSQGTLTSKEPSLPRNPHFQGTITPKEPSLPRNLHSQGTLTSNTWFPTVQSTGWLAASMHLWLHEQAVQCLSHICSMGTVVITVLRMVGLFHSSCIGAHGTYPQWSQQDTIQHTQKTHDVQIVQFQFLHQVVLVQQIVSEMEEWSACNARSLLGNAIIGKHCSVLCIFLGSVTESCFKSVYMTVPARTILRNAKSPSVILLKANTSKFQLSILGMWH